MRIVNKIGILVGVIAVIILSVFYIFQNTNEKEGAHEKEAIGIGVISASQSEIAGFQAIVDYLNKYSDHTWYLVQLKDYGSFITQMEVGQIGAGFVGSAVGYRLIEEELASPVARGEKGGISHYLGYVVVRKDSGIKDIEGLRGKKFAYYDPYTSAGFFTVRYLISTRGFNPNEFFRIPAFLNSNTEIIKGVREGIFDGGAVKSFEWENALKVDPKIKDEMLIIGEGGPFPHATFMIKNQGNTEHELAELKELFLKMGDSVEGKKTLDKFGTDKFIVTTEQDFDIAKKMISQEEFYD